MSKVFECYASAAFGMEGLVASELRKFGMDAVHAENGGVFFRTDAEGVLYANLWSHFSDRIYLLLSETGCKTFEDLYQAVLHVDWESFFLRGSAINISCKCVRSTLMSPRDCQSVAKKAVINRIREKTGQDHFPENGDPLPIQLSVRADRLRILLNTSGEALSRRGYRTWNGEAPLRETLAAALVELSPWRPGIPLHDPCCGTGTLLIEAALTAANRAPGLCRSFAMEKMKGFGLAAAEQVRRDAENAVHYDRIVSVSGSDIDPEALELASRHVRQARLPEGSVQLFRLPLQELCLEKKEGVFLCNPPYGERLSDREHCRKLYADLHSLRVRHPGWKMCVISSDPAFERSYGQRADKKRRLYNGRLECVFYIYH